MFGLEYLRLSVLAAASLAARFSASHFDGVDLKVLKEIEKSEENGGRDSREMLREQVEGRRRGGPGGL